MSFNSNELLAQILDKLNKQEDLIISLSKRLDNIEKGENVIHKKLIYINDEDDYCNYLDEVTIIKYMEMHSIKGDAKLFKKIFLEDKEEDEKTIKFIGKNKFSYKTEDGNWNADAYGVKIRNRFLKNLRKVYYKFNTMTRYKENSEMFITNQIHITKLLDNKYQTKWLNELKLFL